jgi:hypothetical protein
MKSKITIDVDEDNAPIIKVEYVPSEDVRDKLVKKFLEDFGSAFCWARAKYIYSSDAPVINNTVIIRPIQLGQLEEEAQEMISLKKLMAPQIVQVEKHA